MTERRNLLLPDQIRWSSSDPIIQLSNVSKRFGDLQVINDLSLSIAPNQCTVISGQSGTGKSVLLKLMNGLVLPDAGQVTLFGEDLAKISEKQRTELRKRCTMVFQNYALIDSMTVVENIAFPLSENTKIPKSDIEKLVHDLLEMLDLGHAGQRLPSALSGGMKKRVALARAVVSNPEIVLFDEPTTGLDPIMIEFVDSLIEKTQREFGLTSVVVSHDMASNRRLADTIAVLSDGRIVENNTFDKLLTSQHPAVAALMDSAPVSRGIQIETAPDERAETKQKVDTIMVRVSQLHKSFGDAHVLKGISCTIPKGKITVVIGGSGSGKSVLIKHMIGLLSPTSGEVEVFGESLTNGDSEVIRRVQKRIGMLFQGAALFDSLTVQENICFPLVEGRSVSKSEAKNRMKTVAEALGVHHLLDRLPDSISNGERKRVALARALISEPDIVVYDEPTTGQDPVMMKNVDDMIVSANRKFGVTSIVISHDMHSSFRIADQIIMIKEGEVVIAGAPETLMRSADPRVQEFINAGKVAE